MTDLVVMTTHYVLVHAASVTQDLEASGFLGTVGKIAAATIIFFIAIGLIIGVIIGYLVGKSVGRRQGKRD
ncbi:hypothetical protein ACFQ1S_06015 [Kibdelosporangium lantanae]|uniref:Uncharacterized protein n=1 Tax=Kibdelosporangium lantanae TaxID=1497396 RepID=A0ABW3M4G9_9PSEU